MAVKRLCVVFVVGLVTIGCGDASMSSEPLETCSVGIWTPTKDGVSCLGTGTVADEKDCKQYQLQVFEADGRVEDVTVLVSPSKRIIRAVILLSGASWSTTGNTLYYTCRTCSGAKEYPDARCHVDKLEFGGGPMYRLDAELSAAVRAAMKRYKEVVSY